MSLAHPGEAVAKVWKWDRLSVTKFPVPPLFVSFTLPIADAADDDNSGKSTSIGLAM